MKSPGLILCSVAVVLSTACYFDGHGVVEAEFRLSKDSRLPSWFQNSQRFTSNDVKVQIRIYDSCHLRIIISSANLFGRTLAEQIGTYQWHPDSVVPSGQLHALPNWIIVTINGTQEVYEKRFSNDLLWIVDKPIPK